MARRKKDDLGTPQLGGALDIKISEMAGAKGFGGGSTGGKGASSKGGTSRGGARTNRSRSRRRCDIRCKFDISLLSNINLVRDDLAELAYFVKEISN